MHKRLGRTTLLGFVTIVAFGAAGFAAIASAQTVATVNIQNAKVVSTSGDQVNVSFAISNRVGVQPAVKYGVVLFSVGKQNQQVDEQVYNTTLDLGQNQTLYENIVYNAPSYLSGAFEVVVESENADGLPLGMDPAGTVTLKGAPQYLEIVPSSCYLNIGQGATTTQYTIQQGIDVAASQDLVLHCTVINTLGQSVTVTPSFATYYRSVFGSLTGTSTLSSITVPESSYGTAETFIIPKATTPQAYDAVLALAGNSSNENSNTVIAHYVVDGESATAQNIVFDKSSYQAGNTANLSFFWSGSANDFPGSLTGGTAMGTTTLAIQIRDANGASCAKSYNEALAPNQTVVNAAIPITNTCVGPQAAVTLSDASGNVLAESTFATTPTTMPAGQNGTASSATSSATNNPLSPTATVIFIIVILILAAIGIWFAFKNKGTGGGMHVIIVFAVAVAGAGMFAASAAKADTVVGTVYIFGESNHYYNVTYTFNLDNSSYAPGSPINASAYASTATCNNGDLLGVNENIDATVNGQTQTLYNNFVDGGDQAFNQGTFTSQNNSGSYDAVFTASSTYIAPDDEGSYGSVTPVVDEIPYTVNTNGGQSSSSQPQNPPGNGNGNGQSQTPEPTGEPNCNFYSDPSSIVVPQSSQLNYSCTNVTACNIQGGQFGYYPGQPLAINPDFTTNGIVSVTINTSTVYTLACRGGGDNSNFVVNLQANVNVAGPNLFEIAP